jgi:hypothetical protein
MKYKPLPMHRRSESTTQREGGMARSTKRMLFAAAAAVCCGFGAFPGRADDDLSNALQLAKLAPSAAAERMTPRNGPRLAVVCFKTGEQISGINKICYYNCMGSAAAITISVAQICPISIEQ